MISQLPCFFLIQIVILREAANWNTIGLKKVVLKIAAYLLNKSGVLIKNQVEIQKKRVSC